MTLRLPVRLLLSYLVVIAVGAATTYVTVRLLAPPLFDHRMTMTTRTGGGANRLGSEHGSGGSTPHAALVSALNMALLLAIVASGATAGLVAAFVTRRLLRPLDALRAATRRIAAGDYEAKVPLPNEPEMAGLAADVNRLAGNLAATEQRRARLLGDVAHEMRTPLSALDGYVEGLVDGVFLPTPETLQAMAEDLHRLHRLADDLSVLSRAEERGPDLRPVDVDLADLSRRVSERLRPQFDDAGVALAVLPGPPIPVHVDEDRIAQVLTNLLGNALIATPSGGAVTVAVTTRGEEAIASVADTGVGLAPADLERIFERFYRVRNQQHGYRGSGVGLTIARQLARAHGGDVTASSAGPGLGATFTLDLPLAHRAGNHRATAAAAVRKGDGATASGRADRPAPSTPRPGEGPRLRSG